MAFLVSPGVQIVEKDLTNIIPAVATSIGGFAGIFEWGPALEVTTVSSEKDLLAKFGYPKVSTNAASSTRDDWYAAANFLGYANQLQVVRAISDGARNSASEPVVGSSSTISVVLSGTPSASGFDVKVDGTTEVSFSADALTLDSVLDAMREAMDSDGFSSVTADSDGIAGIVDPTLKYSATGITLPAAQTVNGVTFTFFSNTSASTTTRITSAQINNFDDFEVEKSTLVNGSVYARFPGELGNSIGIYIMDASINDSDFKNYKLYGNTTGADLFDTRPGTSTWAGNYTNTLFDEVHVVIYTTDTKITGTANETLETYAYLSKAKNSKTADGAGNFYVDAVNDASNWVYLLNEETKAQSSTIDSDGSGGTALSSIGDTLTNLATSNRFKYLLTNVSLTGLRRYTLGGGNDGSSITDGNYTTAYDLLNDDQVIDVNLLITGERSKTVQKHVITIAEKRKDAIAFLSPSYSAAVNNPTATKVIDYFSDINSTSYAVFDSSWKRQYDRYNDEYFWMPINPDTAGLTARTEFTNEAWYSPAGLNRGFIQNVVKLSFNPNQTDRDQLYPNRINPIVTFRGQGTLLYGDKTALSRPSAFDRINVRRLFIVLEKAIATAAKFQLFEFNDDLTRRTFVNAIEPFLAEVQARRGLTDFKVVCDTSNNTGQVIDSNQFVADIYLKPARSINFITLNFVAVRTGVSFSEVAGA